MTVSSELLLSASYTASASSGKDAVPLGKARSKGADNNATEKAPENFKDLLVQATENNPSGKQVSNTPVSSETAVENTVTEIIHNTNEENFAGNIISEAILANVEPSPAQIIEAGKTHNILSREITENQTPQNETAPSEKENAGTNIAAIQKEGNSDQRADGKPLAQADLAQPTTATGGETSEQPAVGTANTENNRQPSSSENNQANAPTRAATHGQAVREIAQAETTENHGQAVREIAQANRPEASAPDNSQPENSQSENTEVQKESPLAASSNGPEVINISPDSKETGETSTQTSQGQNTPEAEKAMPQGTTAQADGAVTPAGEETDPQINMGAADKVPVTSDQQAAVDNETSKRQTLSPEQQMAAATTPPPLKEADNSKVDKESDKGNKISATDEKNNSDASDNAKGSSQNTSEDKTPASAAQNKTSAAGTEQLHPAKTPFLTELSQSVIGAESKTIGTGTLQLPTGLLVVQEVNPNGLQANAVAAQSQIKPAPSHVSPEMVTKQISLAIMKQVSEGQESFKISLKPAHLGQVDIKMDFHTDGKMVATVTVDNDRTLALLQKDQGALEKALENAGFDAGGNSLNFSLKQQQNEGQTGFANNNTGDGESDDMSSLPGSIISHQQMKMAYSDNLLDINI